MAGLRKGGATDAHTEPWNFFVDFEAIADAIGDLLRGDFAGFREHEREFVAAIARRRVNRTAKY